MSAYIVDDETINHIVSHLEESENRAWNERRLKESVGFKMDSRMLGTTMFALNVEAVGQRYPDCKGVADMPGKIGHVEYEHRYLVCNRAQALKSMRCWLYQCSEGTVATHPVIKAMDEIAADLALAIVADTPEYKKADWG